jgi:L-threonylcarbamoyladenylate synthase
VIATRVLRADAATLAEACGLLSRGAIVAHPTETVYGLAVDPWNAEAIGRLDRVKSRAAGRGYLLIAASTAQALRLAARPWPRPLEALAEAFWPGPLTIVVLPSPEAPETVHRGLAGVAVRVTSDPVAAGLVAACGRPLTSTSANRSGSPPARSAEEVLAALEGAIDLVLDGGRREGGLPSTLVDLTGPEPLLLRAGALSEERLRAALGSRWRRT